jgi:O-antigen ligase
VALGALLPLLASGCAGRYLGPRRLAALGTMAVVAGSASWATGEGLDGGGHPGASRALVNGGFASVAVGLAAIIVAGGWMAGTVACTADPDCNEEEQCREIPAPPGGIPYKQCMPRS